MEDCNDIDPVGALYKKMVAMAKADFNPIAKFWLDELKTLPDPLAGSRFDLTVLDKNGNTILAFSTENNPGGFIIQNTNELKFSKTAAQMNIEPGQYTYNFQRTANDIVVPYSYGPFVVLKNNNPLVVVP